MAHDAVAACFERFQTEVRAEIQKKVDADMASLEEENVQKQKLQDDLVQREHAATTNDYRRKIRLHKQQTEDSASKLSECSDIIQAKETELLCMKTTVADLKSNIKTNKIDREKMVNAIDEYDVKVNLVEMEIQTVCQRNRQIHEENKKLKEKMANRKREQDKRKAEMAEMATFRPKMLDMADRMVVHFNKITLQIVKIDEKQRRIIVEKTAIISQMQTEKLANGAKKRKVAGDNVSADVAAGSLS